MIGPGFAAAALGPAIFRIALVGLVIGALLGFGAAWVLL
jgi:hypothetical protein